MRVPAVKAIVSLCTAMIFLALCAVCCTAKTGEYQTGNQEGKLTEKQTGKAKVPGAPVKPGEILVKFKPGVGEKRIREITRKEGLEIVKIVSPPSLYLLKSRETSPALVDKRITDLKKYKEIEYAEPNYIHKPARN